MDYPFTTDGCSGGMTTAWRLILRRDPPWNDLCVEHDKVYWRGGSAAERRAADRALREAIALRGYPVTAALMWAAVRIGGHPLLPLPWRWGYGWRWPRGYKPA
jgi:hypothetical protein